MSKQIQWQFTAIRPAQSKRKKTTCKRAKIAQTMWGMLLERFANNLSLKVREHNSIAFGVSYNNKTGHAHVHALVAMERDESKPPESALTLLTRIKGYMYLGVGDKQLYKCFIGGRLKRVEKEERELTQSRKQRTALLM